jgi:hypothetical protein
MLIADKTELIDPGPHMLFFMGRRKPIPGGLSAAVQAADTHEKQHVRSLPSYFELRFVGNQMKIVFGFQR